MIRSPSRIRYPSLIVPDEASMRRVGEVAGSTVSGGELLLLTGPLGAGKTVFASGLGSALGVPAMKSPTFTVETVHRLPDGRSLVHADLFRVEGHTHHALSLEESLEQGDIVIVEWGERWTDPPGERLTATLVPLDDGTRLIDIECFGAKAERIAAAMLQEALPL